MLRHIPAALLMSLALLGCSDDDGATGAGGTASTGGAGGTGAGGTGAGGTGDAGGGAGTGGSGGTGSGVTLADCTPGACILELNNDFTMNPSGPYPCCFEVGGSNDCDQDPPCPSGDCSGSCILYAAGATGEGSCCLYEDGSEVDDPAFCAALVDAISAQDLGCP